ncbi:uncharacterized protein N7459_004770 [Penicillium hispanicum]|uniref:uncharacterized protein n=1 Tax=Penicillium hispanicum TaxID=1080232 RepID=UPI0025421A93|nr:uncharacterized protein N7459_004770 [Penicillium hispanicum]KAJ5584970.1 hypothetical protein N7459_004770 [Penicillium hispanicum]
MELTNQNFTNYLPWVLNEISTSCFVSLDLELSGIPMSPSCLGPKTQSLQDRYAENKAAAEKYQILQLGLTICHENTENATYTLKPYNINLSPLVDRSLDVNRDWTFMSWSVEFLLGNQFSIDAICKHGVRYLSREEEAQAVERAKQKYNPEPVEAVEVNETDQESIEFLRAVRQTISNWTKGGKHKQDYLNIPPPYHLQPLRQGLALPKLLSNMQKWLVHQLISAEYPSLTSRSKSHFVQIEHTDPDREKKTLEEKVKAAKYRIQKHVGCRWVVEALVGGDLTDLEPQALNALMARETQPKFTLKEVSDRLKARVAGNRPVFVGHNCFTDLVFFHQCFLGPLPDTVEEFQVRIHELFPMVVDTKYLATHDCGSLNPLSSLEEINRKMAKISLPKIEIDSLHSKYLYSKSSHEAGYDSMLAAIAFIKLSAQLHRGKGMPKSQKAALDDMAIGISSSKTNLIYDLMQDDHQDQATGISQGNLIDLGDEDPTEVPPCSQSLADLGSDDVAVKICHGLLVPRLGSQFWEVYGNRLRVFGTNEKTLHLTGGVDGEMTT